MLRRTALGWAVKPGWSATRAGQPGPASLVRPARNARQTAANTWQTAANGPQTAINGRQTAATGHKRSANGCKLPQTVGKRPQTATNTWRGIPDPPPLLGGI
eukprot:gene23755-biopygen14896